MVLNIYSGGMRVVILRCVGCKNTQRCIVNSRAVCLFVGPRAKQIRRKLAAEGIYFSGIFASSLNLSSREIFGVVPGDPDGEIALRKPTLCVPVKRIELPVPSCWRLLGTFKKFARHRFACQLEDHRSMFIRSIHLIWTL